VAGVWCGKGERATPLHPRSPSILRVTGGVASAITGGFVTHAVALGCPVGRGIGPYERKKLGSNDRNGHVVPLFACKNDLHLFHAFVIFRKTKDGTKIALIIMSHLFCKLF